MAVTIGCAALVTEEYTEEFHSQQLAAVTKKIIARCGGEYPASVYLYKYNIIILCVSFYSVLCASVIIITVFVLRILLRLVTTKILQESHLYYFDDNSWAVIRNHIQTRPRVFKCVMRDSMRVCAYKQSVRLKCNGQSQYDVSWRKCTVI